MAEIFITKSSGEKVNFSSEKLKASLQRSGAQPEHIDEILKQVESKLYDGITTKKIYQIAFRLLKEGSRHMAAKYHLKRAIMELGPSGFPFEKYIAEIIQSQGYETETGKIMQGKCISHEVDVFAKNEQMQLMVECKYHNQAGIFCDVKVPLYIHARFKDIEEKWIQDGNEKLKYQGWLITNTRFSADAIQYGTCAGLKLVGWDFPKKNSLRELIDTLKLYPITCLTSITKLEKQFLLNQKIVLCKELLTKKNILERMGITSSRRDIVMQETDQLCEFIQSEKREEGKHIKVSLFN
jgi:hypothetical protein